MAHVKLDTVRKVYDNSYVAVHGADFEVQDGEFMVLVGPSGCGKSTTLRMIAGLEDISGGELWIGDRVVNDVPPKHRDIAMVFQNYALYPHMTVFDNMAFGLKLRKHSKAEIEQRVNDAAAILGIESILDRKPKQLSGGQRQRVAVGRAIVRKPQVFLFDEPLSNLDAKLRVQMRTEISKLHQRLQATMIYVTHDQVEAMTMGDRIVVLRDGHIQQVDTPMGLYNTPVNRFVAGFIGSPAMNFVEGRLVRADGLRFQAAAGWSIPLDAAERPWLDGYVDGPITLGIRPEDIYMAGSRYVRGTSAEIELRLEVVEVMGSEIVLYATDGTDTLIGRVAPQEVPAAGETLRLTLDCSKLHFFDTETEARLSAASLVSAGA